MPTRPDADCFGPPGGSGAEFTYEKPNALSLLATAGRTTKSVAPLALTDQFGFGLGVCGIGGVQATGRENFWYFKSNHQEATVGADQLEVARRRPGPLLPRPGQLPEPEPGRARAPGAGAGAGRAAVRGHGARAQVRDPVRTAVRDHLHAAAPPPGSPSPAATRRRPPAPTAPRSSRSARSGEAELGATRGTDIPAEVLETCVGATARRLPEGARRAARRQPAGRQDQGHQGRRLRSARAAATTGSTPARAAPT